MRQPLKWEKFATYNYESKPKICSKCKHKINIARKLGDKIVCVDCYYESFSELVEKR